MEENLNNDTINGLAKQTFSALLVRERFFGTVVALVWKYEAVLSKREGRFQRAVAPSLWLFSVADDYFYTQSTALHTYMYIYIFTSLSLSLSLSLSNCMQRGGDDIFAVQKSGRKRNTLPLAWWFWMVAVKFEVYSFNFAAHSLMQPRRGFLFLSDWETLLIWASLLTSLILLCFVFWVNMGFIFNFISFLC